MARKRKKLVQRDTDNPPQIAKHSSLNKNNHHTSSHTYLNFEDDDEDAINSILEFNSNSLSQLNLNSNSSNATNSVKNYGSSPASTPINPGPTNNNQNFSVYSSYSTLPRLPRS